MKLAFLFFILLSSCPWAQAQDFEAKAESAEWLNLLHMEKKWTGAFQSSIRGSQFFLASDGSTNPASELKETYRQMFQSQPELEAKIQCQYLARRDFFIRHFEKETKPKIHACQLSEDWMQKLNTTQVSLVFASAYMNSAASSFGHTFLKLQNPDNAGGKELLDYGINFAARTADSSGALYALYGLFGYFPGNFAMAPYHQIIKEYTHLEGRDLWEYQLNFTKEEVQRMLFHLLELEGVYFEYYFIDDNCSFALLKALEVARPGLELVKDDEMFVIPIDTVKRIQSLVEQIHYRPSLETEWRQREQQLRPEQKRNLKEFYQNPSSEKIQKMDVETLSTAQYLITLKELENRNQWKDLNYQLSRERAKKGRPARDFLIQTPAVSPDQGLHSSALEFGFLEADKDYFLSGLRLAFHDRLSRNEGASPFSHLEVLGFQWRSAEFQKTSLQRYRLLETLSSPAVSAFERPLSWGISVGADSDFENPTRLRHAISGRFGYSFDFVPDQIRWANFLAVGLQQDRDLDFQFTPGWDSKLWLLWSPRIRTGLEFEYWRFPSVNSQKTSAFQVFDLTRQLEFRLGWQSYEEASIQKIEKRVSFVQNLLF